MSCDFFFFFPLLLLIFHLVFSFCQFDCRVAGCVFPWVHPARDSLHFLDLVEYFLFHFREVFDCYLFKYFLRFFLSSPFLSVLVCARFCLCPPRIESAQVLWNSYNKIPLDFKVRFTGDSQCLYQILRLWSLMWGSKPWQLLWYCLLSSSLWVTHQWVGDLILLWLHASYCLASVSSLSLDMGHLFPWVPLSSCCSTASCDFGALRGGEEHTSFYSAILNQKEILHFLYTVFV